MPDIKTIADRADVIVNGYAFERRVSFADKNINNVVTRIKNALKQMPENVKIQVDLSMGIADRIVAVLNAKNMAQKDIHISTEYILTEDYTAFAAEDVI